MKASAAVTGLAGASTPWRFLAALGGILGAAPATAAGADATTPWLPAIVAAALLAHAALLLRLATARGIGTCYRISYVSIYLLATVAAWLLAVVSRDLTAAVLPSLVMLLLPVGVGLLLMARGPHRHASCAMPGPGTHPGSGPP